MLKSIRSKQIILLTSMVLLVGFLFSREVKGLVVPKEDTAAKSAAEDQGTHSSSFTIEQASDLGKGSISAASSKEILSLESDFQKASSADKLEKAKLLAQKWDDLEQPVPSAMYLEFISNQESNLQNWLTTGDRFLKGFENTTDSLVRSSILAKANEAYKKSIAIDSANLDAKTGLGVTIVNGMGAPMSGISLLRDVVAKDPKNLKANMNLGIFAIKSGQFDKAITRFNTIVTSIKATPDAYFYLATAYESLGKNKEAIDAYLQSKKLAASPQLSAFVDKKIADLKK